jgi:hypothetical protein
LRRDERQATEAALKADAAALARLDLALRKSRLEWTLNLTSPVIGNIMLPSMMPQRSTAQLLAAAAILDYDRGDDSAALNNLRRARAVRRYYIHAYPDARKPERGDEWRALGRIVHLTRQTRPATEPRSSAQRRSDRFQ